MTRSWTTGAPPDATVTRVHVGGEYWDRIGRDLFRHVDGPHTRLVTWVRLLAMGVVTDATEEVGL